MAVPVEERVARLEGQVMEQANMMNAVLGAVRDLEKRMGARFAQMESRFTLLEGRFNQVDSRFLQVDNRFLQIDDRISQLDAKMSRQFIWLVGLIVTILVAVVGASGAVMAALVQ